jgi:hypothetical protein
MSTGTSREVPAAIANWGRQDVSRRVIAKRLLSSMDLLCVRCQGLFKEQLDRIL